MSHVFHCLFLLLFLTVFNLVIWMLYIERVFAIYQPSLTAVRDLLICGHEHEFPSFLYQFCDYHELPWDWVEYTVSMDRLFPQNHFCEELEEDMATIMWQ